MNEQKLCNLTVKDHHSELNEAKNFYFPRVVCPRGCSKVVQDKKSNRHLIVIVIDKL